MNDPPPNTVWSSSTTEARPHGPSLEADRVAAEVREQWRRDGRPDAGAVLTEHLEFKRHLSVAIDLAYEEYCGRLKAGEALRPGEFARRFPTLEDSLYLMIWARGKIDRDPRPLGLDDPPAWPEVGDSFLGFQLVAELGRGMLGRVFLANEPALGNREVAVKIAMENGQEARTLGRLQHPNIVPIHSTQQDPNTYLTAFCMPYLGRATLCDVLDRAFAEGRPPVRASAILDAVRAANEDAADRDAPLPNRILRSGAYIEGIALLGAELAEALAHAHSRGIYHRDLKPSNVVLSFDGRPLLLDFNLSVDGGLSPFRVGGTLSYMAPEELAIMAEKGTWDRPWHYDPRSDLFSLGVILYELLTGALPFGAVPRGQTAEETAAALRQREAQGPWPLEKQGAQEDRRIHLLIETCLAFDPERRPQTAAELAARLRRELSPPRRARRWVRYHRRPLMAAGSAVLAIVLIVAGALAMRPAYSVRQFRRGLEYAERGEPALAEECFNEALRFDPQNREILIARARVLCQEGNFRMALDDYQAANRSAPDPALAAKIGYCASRLNQHAEAVAWYQAALKGGYTSPGLLNNIGREFFMLGQLSRSERYFREALQQEPNLAAARHSLLLVLLNRAFGGEPVSGEAIELAKKAAELGPPSRELYRDVAALLALAARQDPSLVQPAIAYLEKGVAYGLDPRTLSRGRAFAVLRGNAAFEELLTKRPAPAPARGDDYLVDP